jgi:large subunit ribosomal protein L25
MAKNVPVIDAEPRDRVGTRYSKRLRQAGRLPAVIYGHGTQPTSVSLDAKSIVSAVKHGTHVIELRVGGSSETCLVKELQYGWMGDDVIHVDLTRVNLEETVRVSVALTFIGQPEAAKRPGAVLTHDVQQLEVECKVRDIPEGIRIDMSQMEGDVMTVAQVKLPAGVIAVTDPHYAVARVVTIAEEAEGEAAATTAAAEPEVLTAKKEAGAEGGAAEKK